MDYRLELAKIFKDVVSKDKDRVRRQIPNLLTLIRGTLAPIFMIVAIISIIGAKVPLIKGN